MNRYKTGVSVVLSLLLIGGAANPALADMADIEAAEQIATEASATVGYRATSVHGAPGRALEFDSLESGPLFKAKFFTDQGPYHLDFKANYLNDNDYSAEVHLDTQSLFRFDLRSTRFFHNLDHIPYANGKTGDPSGAGRAPGPTISGSRPDALFGGAYRAFYSDQNPGDKYGLRLDMNEAKLKIKCPGYPAHLNLSYWRYEKTGERQLRFVGENCATACHMQSKTRKMDLVTEEFKASVDAHAGLVDIVLETLYRAFRDREEIPVDSFGSHSRGRIAGNYDHDENPDSRLTETTLRLNTAPSGGLVGSASFTIGERENRSDLTSVAPVKAETDYYKTAADVTYTPSQNWTFNLRYRLLDMDGDNSEIITRYGSTRAGALNVREALDIKRAWYEAIASYRPSPRLTLKAEFRREDIRREETEPIVAHSTPSNLGLPVIINPNWELPDKEVITRLKLGFNSRLLDKSALKLNGWLAIQNNDDPAYGASFSEGQEVFAAASYSPSRLWGLQANVNLLAQKNNDHELHDFDIERKKEQQTFTLGTWLSPRDGLSFDLNYGYFRTAIDQDLVFGTSAAYAIENDGTSYKQSVQTVTAGVTWQPAQKISCRFEGHHIRSKASYAPDFSAAAYLYGNTLNISGIASSADLRDISKVDIVQNGLKGRVDWQINENLTCGVEATFDDYDEQGNDVFDGSVQSYMASLSYTF